MQKARLDESQAGIKIVRRHTNNLRCADETTLMAESEDTDAHVWGKTDSPKYVEHKTLRAAVSRGT